MRQVDMVRLRIEISVVTQRDRKDGGFPFLSRTAVATRVRRWKLAAGIVAMTFPFAGMSWAQPSVSASVNSLSAQAGIVADCGVAASTTVGAGNVDYVMVYKSRQSIVCVDSTQWANPTYAAAIPSFFPYLDAVVTQDKALFPAKTPSTQFVFEIAAPFGGGHTGFDLKKVGNGGSYGNTVSIDFFTASYSDPLSKKPIKGFWGYLFPLHESVNVFTGLLASGWPTDWWADHRSPFPNAMDIAFMKSIANSGTPLSNAAKQTLLASSAAQSSRFTDKSNPTGEYDPEVTMLVDFFNTYGGFKAYANTFNYAINEDDLKWSAVSGDTTFTGDNNHSEKLSEYVIAYLHLGFGATHNLTSTFSGAGVGTLDTAIPSYTINSSNVKTIADAHCSIQAAKGAGVDVSAQLSILQSGNFGNAMAWGGTQASCPSECSFTMNKCVAKF